MTYASHRIIELLHSRAGQVEKCALICVLNNSFPRTLARREYGELTVREYINFVHSYDCCVVVGHRRNRRNDGAGHRARRASLL